MVKSEYKPYAGNSETKFPLPQKVRPSFGGDTEGAEQQPQLHLELLQRLNVHPDVPS